MDLAGWLERNALLCSYKRFLGVEGPGCGAQRALVELLRGNFQESLDLFPALIPLLLMYLLVILHLVFKFQWGAKAILYIFIATVLIIIGDYFIRML